MTHEQADILLFYLQNIDGVFRADVYDRTADATIHYKGNRETIIEGLRRFRYEEVEVPNGLLETSGRAMNAEYQEKLVDKILFHYGRKFLLPYPISAAYTTIMSAKYIWKGIKTLMERRIEVPVLDATAIGVSIFRSDFSTASSIMFLLGIGELLEEWTHKKSVDDLARTMSLNVGKVWLKTGDQTVLVSSNQIKSGDQVVVHMGNVIPFDGEVVDGEAMINQASLTGESVPVRRTTGNYVYAGTVLEEGELTIRVKETSGSTKFEKIVTRYPETLKCIPLLLAVRGNEIYAQDEDGAFLYNFKTMNYEVEQYKVFMRKTGLFDMIANHLVNNLVDYALGIETGLDSNGRKNRGGHQMEDLVEKYIVAAGFKKNENYFKEMYLKDIESRWNIDLSALSNQGKAAKRFDFVIKTDKMIYAIETNFYASGGSKLNETARSYKMLSQEADTIDGFTFVWFTDGIGWKNARGNLRETFEVMYTIYSIDDMENGVIEKLTK